MCQKNILNDTYREESQEQLNTRICENSIFVASIN